MANVSYSREKRPLTIHTTNDRNAQDVRLPSANDDLPAAKRYDRVKTKMPVVTSWLQFLNFTPLHYRSRELPSVQIPDQCPTTFGRAFERAGVQSKRLQRQSNLRIRNDGVACSSHAGAPLSCPPLFVVIRILPRSSASYVSWKVAPCNTATLVRAVLF